MRTAQRIADKRAKRRAKHDAERRAHARAVRLAEHDTRALVAAYSIGDARRVSRAVARTLDNAVARAKRTIADGTRADRPADGRGGLMPDAELAAALGITLTEEGATWEAS